MKATCKIHFCLRLQPPNPSSACARSNIESALCASVSYASDPAISWYSFEINPSPVTAVVALSCQTARIRPNKQTLLLLLHLAVQPYNYYVGECSMLEYFLLINRKMLSTTTRYTRLFLKTNTLWGQLTFKQRRRQREIDHCNGHGYT